MLFLYLNVSLDILNHHQLHAISSKEGFIKFGTRAVNKFLSFIVRKRASLFYNSLVE
jgi:hypothetical protein